MDSMASAGLNTGIAQPRPNAKDPVRSDVIHTEPDSQAVKKTNQNQIVPDAQKHKQNRVEHRSMNQSEEVRKVEIEDGEMTINVYDGNGKLLRKTPPGYLPVGEQGFDITI